MELKLGKMTGKEIAAWLGISYESTYAKKPAKYIERLMDYCEYEQVRGGVIINKIYIPVYNRYLKTEVEKTYVQELTRRSNIISMTGMAETTGHSRYLNTRARNHLYGNEPTNVNANAHGLLGSRELIWVIKLEGANNYRELTDKEQELLNALVTQVYSNVTEDQVSATAVLLQYCVDENKSAAEYQTLLKDNNLDFFGNVVLRFKEITNLSLALGTKHTNGRTFDEAYAEEKEYREMLIKEIAAIEREMQKQK